MDFEEKVGLIEKVQEVRNLLGVKTNGSYLNILKGFVRGMDLDEKRQVKQVHQVMRGEITDANKDVVGILLDAAKRYGKARARSISGPQS